MSHFPLCKELIKYKIYRYSTTDNTYLFIHFLYEKVKHFWQSHKTLTNKSNIYASIFEVVI